MIGPRMPHRVSGFRVTGHDARGNPVSVSSTNVPCRITYSMRMIRGPTGDDVRSEVQIETQHPYEVGDLINLPGETAARAVLKVERIDGIGGKESHREVYL